METELSVDNTIIGSKMCKVIEKYFTDNIRRQLDLSMVKERPKFLWTKSNGRTVRKKPQTSNMFFIKLSKSASFVNGKPHPKLVLEELKQKYYDFVRNQYQHLINPVYNGCTAGESPEYIDLVFEFDAENEVLF